MSNVIDFSKRLRKTYNKKGDDELSNLMNKILDRSADYTSAIQDILVEMNASPFPAYIALSALKLQSAEMLLEKVAEDKNQNMLETAKQILSFVSQAEDETMKKN